MSSKAHFFQTELRYLLRRQNWIEVPIHYTSPSPRVSSKALSNALQCLFYYVMKHWLTGGKEINKCKHNH